MLFVVLAVLFFFFPTQKQTMAPQLAKGQGLETLKKTEVQGVFLFQQRILSPAGFPINVKRSDHGLGAFATAPIPTGTELGGYEGRRFTQGEYNKYYRKKRDRSKLFGIWSWTDTTKSNKHVVDYIDANRAPKKGDKFANWTSMMNHSETPNVARKQTVDKNIVFTTNKDIVAGDELFINYGSDYFGNEETDDSNFSKVAVVNGKVGFRHADNRPFEPYYFVENNAIFPLSLVTLRRLRIDYATAAIEIIADLPVNTPTAPIEIIADLPATTPTDPRIFLIGDSILDNSYWNNVGEQGKSTGQLLTSLVDVDVVDYSAEEMSAKRLLECINTKEPYVVGDRYVQARKATGYPYPPTLRYDQDHLQLTAKDAVYLSVGGNDRMLLGTTDAASIVNTILAIKQKLAPATVTYIVPYPPTTKDVKPFYDSIVPILKRKLVDFISLEDFSDEDRRGEYIPEPTVNGSIKIAKRIQNHYLKKKSDGIPPNAMAHLTLLHPNLYIGDIRAATGLANNPAWNVICLTPRCGPFATSLYYHKADMSDAVNGEMSRDAFYQHMDEVIPYIQSSLSASKKTLVNCHGGINRSASAIAYWAGMYVLPFSAVFHTMTDIMGYIRRQNNDQRNNHPALTNTYFVQYILDKDSMHERKITIRRGDQCAGLVLETQQDNLKKGLKYSNMFTVESLREKAAALHQQLKDLAIQWNRIAGKFEHNVEEIRSEFQDEDSIVSIEQLRQFVMDRVPELRGSKVLPGMTYIRFKNAKHANTDAHTDYDNVVEQRKVVSKEEAPRVRTVWVPLHDVLGSQSFLQFVTKKRNRLRGKESFVFEAGDVVVFGLKVKHKGTLQKSDKWRLSMDFRVLLPESSSDHVYYKGITSSSAIDVREVAFMETFRKWHVTTVDGRAVDNVCAAVATASTITFSNRPALAGGGSADSAEARIVQTTQTPTALVVEYEVYTPIKLTWKVNADGRAFQSTHTETGRYQVQLPLDTNEPVTLEMLPSAL
jgi:hypothetical protein